jgi:uncharacterized protein (UPF0261 family)
VAVVALIGTFDTKGAEFGFVRSCLEAHGIATVLVDAGAGVPASIEPDISRHQVAAAGGWNREMLDMEERAVVVDALARGAAAVLAELHATRGVAGVFTLGESSAATIGTRAMRALPYGIPKVLLSTVVSGDTRPYLGGADIVMMYPVVEISGLNRISTLALTNAANALAGMVQAQPLRTPEDKSVVATTGFGLTAGAVDAARSRLEALGYEVLGFHATGTGGDSMEAMVRSGLIRGVLDITTSELVDLIAGGTCAPAPSRLEAAGEMGIPQVVSLGALDMVNFGPESTVPARYRDRTLLRLTAAATLMRTDAEECAAVGELMADKLNRAAGPVTVMIPLRGFSHIDAEGGAFEDPTADAALIAAMTDRLEPWVEVVELDTHINDPAFAWAMADRLHESFGAAAAGTRIASSLNPVTHPD